MVIDVTGSVEDIYAFIFLSQGNAWQSGMTTDWTAFFCCRARWPWGRRQIFQGGAGQESKSSGAVGAKVKPYRVGAFSGWGRAGRGSLRAIVPRVYCCALFLCIISGN